MATRPTKTIDWASDPSALVIEPSSGYKTAGFAGGDPLIADYENWLRKQIDTWLNYVNEATWSAPISASSAVVVEDTGKTWTRPSGSFLDEGFAVGQTVTWFGFANPENNVTGIVTTLTDLVMTISAATGLVDETGSGDEHCNAHFKMVGQVTIAPSLGATDYALIVRGGDVLLDVGANLRVSGTSAFSDVATFNGNASVPTGQKITLVGTADIKHGDRILLLSGYNAFLSDVAPGWTVGGGPGFVESTAGAIAYMPVPLKVGDRIRDVVFATYDNGATQWTNVLVQHYSKTGALTTLGSTGVVNPGAAWQDVAIAVTDTTLVDGDQIFIEFVSAGAGVRIGSTRVTYDRP